MFKFNLAVFPKTWICDLAMGCRELDSRSSSSVLFTICQGRQGSVFFSFVGQVLDSELIKGKFFSKTKKKGMPTWSLSSGISIVVIPVNEKRQIENATPTLHLFIVVTSVLGLVKLKQSPLPSISYFS